MNANLRMMTRIHAVTEFQFLGMGKTKDLINDFFLKPFFIIHKTWPRHAVGLDMGLGKP